MSINRNRYMTLLANLYSFLGSDRPILGLYTWLISLMNLIYTWTWP